MPLFYEWSRDYIKEFRLNGRKLGEIQPLNVLVDNPMDIEYGPEGALYYVDLGYSDISATFGVSKIRRISFVNSDLPPTALASADTTGGPPPLTVQFSYNDLNDLEQVFATFPGQIAAVVMEAETVEPPASGYFDGLRKLCHDQGALLMVRGVDTGMMAVVPLPFTEGRPESVENGPDGRVFVTAASPISTETVFSLFSVGRQVSPAHLGATRGSMAPRWAPRRSVPRAAPAAPRATCAPTCRAVRPRRYHAAPASQLGGSPRSKLAPWCSISTSAASARLIRRCTASPKSSIAASACPRVTRATPRRSQESASSGSAMMARS